MVHAAPIPTAALFRNDSNTNAGTVQVASGAIFQGNITNSAIGVLRGAGTVTGNVNLSLAGASLEAGANTADPNLTITNGLTMAVDSRYTVKLYGTATGDISRVNVTGGTTNINSGADLRLDLSALDLGQVSSLRTTVLGEVGGTRNYTVLNSASAISGGGFDAADFTIANLGNFAAGEWTFVSSSGNNVILNFTPVPEPATALAVGAAGLGLIGWARRKRANAARGKA